MSDSSPPEQQGTVEPATTLEDVERAMAVVDREVSGFASCGTAADEARQNGKIEDAKRALLETVVKYADSEVDFAEAERIAASTFPPTDSGEATAEILDALESANALFRGWHFDGLWSEHDESVRRKIQRILNKLHGIPEHIGMEIPPPSSPPPAEPITEGELDPWLDAWENTIQHPGEPHSNEYNKARSKITGLFYRQEKEIERLRKPPESVEAEPIEKLLDDVANAAVDLAAFREGRQSKPRYLKAGEDYEAARSALLTLYERQQEELERWKASSATAHESYWLSEKRVSSQAEEIRKLREERHS